MIIMWMLWATTFAALLGVAALAAERIARGFGRQGRWAWTIALTGGALWPVALPLMESFLPSVSIVAASLPAIRIGPGASRLIAPAATEAATDAGTLLLCLWILASGALTWRLGRGVVALRRVRAEARVRVVDETRVLVHAVCGPAALGVVDPAVLVNPRVLELDVPLRGMVLRHEREHCDARDPALLLAAAVAVAAFPWNPALWWIARRLHLAVEVDCDARVIAGGADATRYGQLLLWTAQHHMATPLAPMLAARPSHLERRIIAMTTRLRRPRPLQLALIGSVLIVALAAACGSDFDGTVRPSASVAPPPAPVGPPPAPALDGSQRQIGREGSAALFEYQVEEQVRQIPGTGLLRYPDVLRANGVEGEILAQFVVDTAGLYESGTFKALRSDDPLFTAAVATALPSMRFQPARVGGRKVRQLVQQPFTFAMSK